MKNFLKQFVGILMGILLIGSVFAVVSQRNNSKNEISQKRILFTDTGLPGGDPIIDVNTGGNTISYGPLLDGLLNPYITGYSETDPVFMANSGDYLPLAGNDVIENPIYGNVSLINGLSISWGEQGPGKLLNIKGNQSAGEKLSLTYRSGDNMNSIFNYIKFRGENGVNFQYQNGDYLSYKSSRFGDNGFVYDSDYSADYTDRSLVDKGYVDGELSGIETFWEFDGVTLNPTATGDVSLKIGLGSQANISNSASIGQYAYANGTGSYAFGNSAWALGEGSFAIGGQANADGRNAYSVGFYSQANQEDSYVFGNQSLSNGFGAMVFGQYAKANNAFSTAIGYSSQANADYSISAGNNTITNSVSSMAIGRYNVGNADSVFEVGFGTNTGRANLFEVKNNGNIYVSKLTGYTCLATDSAGMVYDNTGVFANYIPYTSVDTGFNHTGSDTIIPSEKTVWGLVDGLTNNYIPYRSGDRMYNSNFINTLYGIQHTGNILTGIALKIQTGNIVLGGLHTTIYGGTRNVLFGNGHILSGNDNLLIGDDSSTQSSRGFVGGEGSAIGIGAHNSFVFGDRNASNGYNSFSIGVLSRVFHNYSFMRTDDLTTPHQTVRDNTFIVYTQGGFGINTNNPLTGGLSVSGSIQIPGDNYFYIGNNWRITTSGGNLSFQAYTGGIWVEKDSIAP